MLLLGSLYLTHLYAMLS